MQVERHADLPRRMLDNWSRLYDRQIGTGEAYTDHRLLLCLWILDVSIPDMPAWFDAVDITRRSDGRPISRDFLMITLQLERWRSLYGRNPCDRTQGSQKKYLKNESAGSMLDTEASSTDALSGRKSKMGCCGARCGCRFRMDQGGAGHHDRIHEGECCPGASTTGR